MHTQHLKLQVAQDGPRFGLARDYSMVSSTCSEARRGLAKTIGDGIEAATHE